MDIPILYEDKDLIVLDKPAGLLVHGIYSAGKARHSEPTLTDWLLANYPEIAGVGDAPSQRPGIVHRLDRETSGIMVVARSPHAFNYLKDLFKTRQIKKTYLALVWGNVEENEGLIDKPISIVDGSVRRTVFKGKMQREAITEYVVLERFSRGKNSFTLLRVQPKTGRTHQIRVHMASLGHPIVGDKLYGKKQAANAELALHRHFLHADNLQLPLLNGEQIEIGAEMPDDLKDFLARIRSETPIRGEEQKHNQE